MLLAGRTTYSLCALFSTSRFKVPLARQHILCWGGIRGSLALALALALPNSVKQREGIVTITFAAVVFSVIAKL